MMEVIIDSTSGVAVMTVVIPYTEMQRRVKEETSHLSASKYDNEGRPLFEALVLDEGNESKFRRLFVEAKGEAGRYVSAYSSSVLEVSHLLETGRAGGEDYIVQLVMPVDFNAFLADVTGINMERFFESYIMYRWLANKLPAEAEDYRLTADKLKHEIKADLDKRRGSIVRPNVFY